MFKESTDNDHDTAITAQAIIELTEANVSAAGRGAEWEREVGFLRDSADESASRAEADDLHEFIDLATALA